MKYVTFKGDSFNPDPKPIKKEKAVPKKKKALSIKRQEENKVYLTLRKVFLNDKICPVTGQKATQIHHKAGRVGKLLTDVRYFLAVSDEGHRMIEGNPEWAKKMGYSVERLNK